MRCKDPFPWPLLPPSCMFPVQLWPVEARSRKKIPQSSQCHPPSDVQLLGGSGQAVGTESPPSMGPGCAGCPVAVRGGAETSHCIATLRSGRAIWLGTEQDIKDSTWSPGSGFKSYTCHGEASHLHVLLCTHYLCKCIYRALSASQTQG